MLELHRIKEGNPFKIPTRGFDMYLIYIHIYIFSLNSSYLLHKVQFFLQISQLKRNCISFPVI